MAACQNCIYFAIHAPTMDEKNPIYGQCRRNPPTVHMVERKGHIQAETRWATVTKEDWCGEFNANIRSSDSRFFWDEDDSATD
jgi:hypothetical protein